MKVFIHGFWGGFVEKTDANHCGFFLDLFKQLFQENIEISTEINECDILLESIFSRDTFLLVKKWKYSFFFYGESKIRAITAYGEERMKLSSQYSCVLCGERNHGNTVNLPLFAYYIYGNNMLDKLENPKNTTNTNNPKNLKKSICAVISNAGGSARNKFIQKLEAVVPIDYAGEYKNNVPRIGGLYNSAEMFDFVSQYKFIVSMENSRDDTYITEKIINGFISGVVPIYWGSTRINDYFNPKRFLCLENDDDASMDNLISKIDHLLKNDDEYNAMLNEPIFNPEYSSCKRNMDNIVNDIRQVLFPKEWPLLNQTYVISSPEFEPDRHEKIRGIFEKTLKLSPNEITYICPTYKHMITPEIMQQYMKEDWNEILGWPNRKTTKSEMSLFINFITILENIEKNYSAGMFLVLENDVSPLENIGDFNEFLHIIDSKRRQDNNLHAWDMISIGNLKNEMLYSGWWWDSLTNQFDKYRLVQKRFTRCFDSIIWSYSGVIKFLEIVRKENNYGLAFDHYVDHVCLENNHIHFCWSSVNFFIQGSFGLGEKSNVQNDDS